MGVFSFSFDGHCSFMGNYFSRVCLCLYFYGLVSVGVGPVVRLDLFTVVILLIIVLCVRDSEFTGLGSRVGTIGEELSLLLRGGGRVSSVDRAGIPPILVRGARRRPSLPAPIGSGVRSISRIRLPRGKARDRLRPRPIS